MMRVTWKGGRVVVRGLCLLIAGIILCCNSWPWTGTMLILAGLDD